MSFKAINNLVGLNSLIFTILVYSIYLQITEYNPSLLIVLQQALAIRKAINKVCKLST
jgi:hypothetical protein